MLPNTSFLGTIKQNYRSKISNLVKIFSSTDTQNVENQERRRYKGFLRKHSDQNRHMFKSLLRQEDAVMKLIDLYRQNECLWNPNSINYLNETLHRAVWTEIAKELDEHLTADQVKQKIFVLRRNFELETERIQKSISDGSSEVYLPQLYYYSRFKFLDEIVLAKQKAKKEASEARLTRNISDTCISICDRSDSEEFIPSAPSWYEPIEIIHSKSSILLNRSKSNNDRVNITRFSPTTKLDEKSNKSIQLNNLCEVIKIDLQNTSDEVFFEAKWKILDILRQSQLKQLRKCCKNSKFKVTTENSGNETSANVGAKERSVNVIEVQQTVIQLSESKVTPTSDPTSSSM